jgi:hypothetical protein
MCIVKCKCNLKWSSREVRRWNVINFDDSSVSNRCPCMMFLCFAFPPIFFHPLFHQYEFKVISSSAMSNLKAEWITPKQTAFWNGNKFTRCTGFALQLWFECIMNSVGWIFCSVLYFFCARSLCRFNVKWRSHRPQKKLSSLAWYFIQFVWLLLTRYYENDKQGKLWHIQSVWECMHACMIILKYASTWLLIEENCVLKCEKVFTKRDVTMLTAVI